MIEERIERIVRQALTEGYGKNVEIVVDRLRRVHSDEELRKIIENWLETDVIEYLGASNRSVYSIDNDYVLKVNNPNASYNQQNKVEASLKSVSIWGDWAPRVIARGPKFRWIVSEKVETSYSDFDWMAKAKLNYDGISSMSDVNKIMGIVSGAWKLYQDSDKIIGTGNEGRRFFVEMIPYEWERDPHGIHPVYGKMDKEGMMRFFIDKTMRNREFNSPKEIDQFVQDFLQHDFVRRAIYAHKEVGARFGDYMYQNLGYTFDGRPVVLDTGF